MKKVGYCIYRYFCSFYSSFFLPMLQRPFLYHFPYLKNFLQPVFKMRAISDNVFQFFISKNVISPFSPKRSLCCIQNMQLTVLGKCCASFFWPLWFQMRNPLVFKLLFSLQVMCSSPWLFSRFFLIFSFQVFNHDAPCHHNFFGFTLLGGSPAS